MSEPAVYVALVQARSFDDSRAEPILRPGATFRCYVLDETQDAALERIVSRLTNNEYELVTIEWIEPAIAGQWAHSWDTDDQAVFDQAAAGDDVIYGKMAHWT